MLTSDPGRQIADIPTPDLIRCNGPEYIRPFILTFTGSFLRKRKANAVCNTCSLQTKLELLLN